MERSKSKSKANWTRLIKRIVGDFPKYKKLVFIFVSLLIGLFSYVIWSNTKYGVKDFTTVTVDELKDALFGTNPHIFACLAEHKTKQKDSDVLPKHFTMMNSAYGSKYTFASLNCSRVLPSGKTIYDRFQLDKSISPVIFGTAPWARPRQASREALRNAESLSSFFVNHLAPKATPIASDKFLSSFCGFNHSEVMDRRSTEKTCVVLMKGKRHNGAHSKLENRLVSEYPKQKFAIVDASKYRLSFENPFIDDANDFALKVYALRHGSYFMPMSHPLTWDYLNTFVRRAIGSPLYSYSYEGEDEVKPFSLLKATSPLFKLKKERSESKLDSNDDSEVTDGVDEKRKRRRKEHGKNKKGPERETNDDFKASDDSSEDLKKEFLARQREKERLKREKMEEESANRFSSFEEESHFVGDDRDIDDADDEEDIIEL